MRESNVSQILIVEDNLADGEVLMKRLQYIGCDVTLVETGEAAQDVLMRQSYELIVIDLVLPGLDGWELIDWMHDQSRIQHMKTVSITANYDPQVALRAKKAGFLHCFPKPESQKVVADLQKYIEMSI